MAASEEFSAEERVGALRGFLAKAMRGEIEKAEHLCETHGKYVAYKAPTGWSECDTCREERSQREQEERRERQEFEFKQRQAEQRLRRASIPPRFADRRLSNYAPQCEAAKKAHQLAMSYAKNFEEALATGASLILCGGVGTGKTHLAVGIAHEVLAKEKSAVFTSVMGAVRAVKETYRKDSKETERDVIDEFIGPSLLILDEVGVQFGSDTEKLILFEIINGRYENLKPTILISNLAKDALAQFIGERVMDRLREGGGKLIAFDWPSYRRQV